MSNIWIFVASKRAAAKEEKRRDAENAEAYEKRKLALAEAVAALREAAEVEKMLGLARPPLAAGAEGAAGASATCVGRRGSDGDTSGRSRKGRSMRRHTGGRRRGGVGDTSGRSRKRRVPCVKKTEGTCVGRRGCAAAKHAAPRPNPTSAICMAQLTQRRFRLYLAKKPHFTTIWAFT